MWLQSHEKSYDITSLEHMIKKSFFLNQQFIIWSSIANHSNYYVVTYNQRELTWKIEKEKEKEEREL